MDLADLKHRSDVNRTGTKVVSKRKRNLNNGIKPKAFNIEDFKGKLNLQHMSEDWNNEFEKKEGRWSAEHNDWRTGFINGFLRCLGASRERVEIVVVCHSSSLRFLVDDRKFSMSNSLTMR